MLTDGWVRNNPWVYCISQIFSYSSWSDNHAGLTLMHSCNRPCTRSHGWKSGKSSGAVTVVLQGMRSTEPYQSEKTEQQEVPRWGDNSIQSRRSVYAWTICQILLSCSVKHSWMFESSYSKLWNPMCWSIEKVHEMKSRDKWTAAHRGDVKRQTVYVCVIWAAW